MTTCVNIHRYLVLAGKTIDVLNIDENTLLHAVAKQLDNINHETLKQMLWNHVNKFSKYYSAYYRGGEPAFLVKMLKWLNKNRHLDWYENEHRCFMTIFEHAIGKRIVVMSSREARDYNFLESDDQQPTNEDTVLVIKSESSFYATKNGKLHQLLYFLICFSLNFFNFVLKIPKLSGKLNKSIVRSLIIG